MKVSGWFILHVVHQQFVVSMIDGRLFDKLEQLARLVRRNPKPFGGIQLVVCGDFFQLPPVPDSLGSGQKVPIKFAFEAETWNAAIPNMLVLKQVFRQKEGGQSLVVMLLEGSRRDRFDLNAKHDETGGN